MSRFAEIATSLDPDVLLLRRLQGREELGRLGGYELELLSVDGSLDLDKLLGYGINVAVEQWAEERRYIGGYVTRIEQGGRHGRFHVYHATIRPWLWFLTRTSNCRIYQDMTVPDILKEVFIRHPVADIAFELIDDYEPWPYCVQYRETDFDFISRLMEDEGIYYYFKHLEGKHTMVIADSYVAHARSPDAELPYIEEENFVRNERRHISRWSVQRELQPGRYATNDFDFEKPGVALHASSTLKRDHPLSDYEVFDYPGDYRNRKVGEVVARTRVEEMHAKFERMTGDTNSRALAVGQLFTMTHHTREDQNAEYLVVSTEIEITSSAHEAMDDEGAKFSCRFTALRSQHPFRPERLTPKPIVHGPQTAVTVGAEGEEIYTDKFGRVKVHFHWDRFDNWDDKSSCWIRVSQNWGGKGWGGMFIPHVGQEVIVEFLEGDPDSPLITGRVYNADNMPPIALPAGKTQSVIRDYGANRIVLEGVDGKQKITMYSPSSNTWITMGDV